MALNSIGMGFFFLLAGFFTPRSCDRKGGVSFLRDRLIRLGLPWLVHSLLLEPLACPFMVWRSPMCSEGKQQGQAGTEIVGGFQLCFLISGLIRKIPLVNRVL